MKKNIFILFLIFSLVWYFNYCTPLIFDDYVYSFVWQDKAMGVPLTETTQRISGFGDIVDSQWRHYFTWGGRTVAHFLAQTFLWWGKDVFNFLNTGCFIILLLEMEWIINEGEIGLNFSAKDILWLFGSIWSFSVYLGAVFTWLTVSCNYLWTTMILLTFMLVYERHYIWPEKEYYNHTIIFFFFLLGILAGWTNENVPCFIILILGFHLVKGYKKEKRISPFLLFGLLGLFFGYMVLVGAPGNYVRYTRQLTDGIIDPGISLIRENFLVLRNVLLIRIIMYFYVIRNLYLFYRTRTYNEYKNLYNMSLFFLIISFTTMVIMVFSPYFRYRSSFPGLIFLIISGGFIRRIKKLMVAQKKYNGRDFKHKIFFALGGAYICVTVLSSLYVWHLQKDQTQIMLSKINFEKKVCSNKILVVQERPNLINKDLFKAFIITGGHVIYPYSITPDADCWINKDIALYYGIKAIRSEK